MNMKQVCRKLMQEHTEIALATSVGGQPHVRIVNFFYDPDVKVIFFTTFSDNAKVQEFRVNDRVAFTTFPREGNAHVRGVGRIQESARPLGDVAYGFVERIPGYKDTLDQAGEFLKLYEIHFQEVHVTVDFENSGVVVRGDID